MLKKQSLTNVFLLYYISTYILSKCKQQIFQLFNNNEENVHLIKLVFKTSSTPVTHDVPSYISPWRQLQLLETHTNAERHMLSTDTSHADPCPPPLGIKQLYVLHVILYILFSKK